jgi:predicted lipid carrier protein YhbT
VAKFLTQDWLDLQVELAKDLPARPGVTARTQYRVTGTPDGDVTFHVVVEDGRIVGGAIGDDQDADVSHTVTYKDFVPAAKGDVDANALFMQGKLKMVGSTATLLTLMPLTQSAEYRAVLDKVDAATDY